MLPLQSLELPAGWPLAMRLLKDFAGGVVRSLRLFSETGERLSLFGVDVLLGQTVMVVPQAKLANEQAVRAWLAEAPAGDASCVLRFVTDRIDTVRFWYPDWMTDGRHRMSPTSASEQNLGEADHIAIEFPGRWRVEVTAERSAFADRLDDAVLVAIEHLDHDEQEAVFGALAVLFGWRPERERDWSSRRLPDTGYTFLQLTDRLGMVVQPGDEGAPPRVVEIVRPSQLRSYLNGG
jgi:hypothetical protein